MNRAHYQEQAGLYKALSHPVRLQILEVVREGEACVCHLEAVVGKRQSYISQQVSVLKQARLLVERREGQFIFYSLANPELAAVIDDGLALLEKGDRQGRSVATRLPPENPPGVSSCTCPRCLPDAEMTVGG